MPSVIATSAPSTPASKRRVPARSGVSAVMSCMCAPDACEPTLFPSGFRPARDGEPAGTGIRQIGLGATMGEEIERVSDDEIEAEEAVSLPDKEVMSVLDVNANVDLGLNLAAPVDLAVAANLNVAAPIEAAASANLLSADAEAVSLAQQHGAIDQGISGSADATAPQHAEVSQDADADQGDAAPASDPTAANALDPAAGGATGEAAGAPGDAVGDTGDAGGEAGGGAGGRGGGATGEAAGAPGDAVGDTGDAVGEAGGVAGGAVGDAAGGVAGGVGDLLQGGSLLDANVDIHANANLAAPVNGAVAANANVAAPIDAAVAANIGSDHAVAQSLADQQVDIHQHLDDVEANATSQQDATVDQD